MATQLPIAAASFTQTTNVVEDITSAVSQQQQHPAEHGTVATSTQYVQINTPHHFTTQQPQEDGGHTEASHSALVLSALSSQPGISAASIVANSQSLQAIETTTVVTGVGNGGAGHRVVTASGGETDLHQVLSGLQQSGELSSVLQHQPHLVEDLSAIAAGEVSSDPEHLRFQYSMADTEPGVNTNRVSKKTKPTVYREQDRFLPIHNVSRIMRNAVPKSGKVSKDAKECMQECVSEFVSFITSEASDKCIQEKRKTITGDDILLAMATLGFDNYIEPLKVYLQKYREFTKADKIAAVSVVLPTTTTATTTTARQLNNVNPNHQQQMVPNVGGTVTMTPVTITPNGGDISSQRQPTTTLSESYSGFTGQLS